MTKLSKSTRDRIVQETAKSVANGTPDDVLLRQILHKTEYTLSGAQKLLQEAKIRGVKA